MGENALNNPGTRIAYINTNFGRHPTVPIFSADLKTVSLNLLVRRLNPVCSQNCKQVFFWRLGPTFNPLRYGRDQAVYIWDNIVLILDFLPFFPVKHEKKS